MELDKIRVVWMRTAIVLAVALLAAGVGEGRAEVSCYRTPAQAALQVGEQEGGGYRLETLERDAFGGKTWAKVRSCAHPEWPAVIVAGSVEPHEQGGKAAVEKVNRVVPAVQVVMAGKRVRVVRMDAMSMIEMSGITQAGGRVGDHIWVRILSPGNDGEQRLVLAIVRSAELLELES